MTTVTAATCGRAPLVRGLDGYLLQTDEFGGSRRGGGVECVWEARYTKEKCTFFVFLSTPFLHLLLLCFCLVLFFNSYICGAQHRRMGMYKNFIVSSLLFFSCLTWIEQGPEYKKKSFLVGGRE
ncbi:hypothetical protein ACQKWADRAFT_116037 [Trichoderma austrokoningii]